LVNEISCLGARWKFQKGAGMRILHILRSEPDEMVRMFIREVSESEESMEVTLYQGEVDYQQLLKDIFASDRVISWW
jgi:hypothetical protein